MTVMPSVRVPVELVIALVFCCLTVSVDAGSDGGERQQSYVACAFDSSGKVLLMRSAGAG